MSTRPDEAPPMNGKIVRTEKSWIFHKKYCNDQAFKMRKRTYEAYIAERNRRIRDGQDVSRFTEPAFRELVIQRGLEVFEAINEKVEVDAEYIPG